MHEAGSHVVAQNSGWDAVVHHLPGGKPRTLQKGTGFVRVNMELVAPFDGRADHAQRHAVSAGGEGALQAAMSSSYMVRASAISAS